MNVTSVISENNNKLTAEKQQLETNLSDLNNKLSSENERLRRDKDDQTVIIGNLTKEYNVLEMKIKNLTGENQQLKIQNQQLEKEKNKLTEQIQNIENTVIQQNFDAYDTIKDGSKQRELCLKGWLYHQSSCYAVHNPTYAGQKTWEEAQENCRGKNSDLAVIVNEDEKTFIRGNSWKKKGLAGYWIGLRVEDRKWKWIDGSDLTKKSWMTETAYKSDCAITVHNKGWESALCGTTNGWICKKAALSV
ncbi:killer cell lectin-like receptor subfamily B member 1A [Scomber japonicus]|uniref:killer cell lectin-like receptor subfamily B member 1A n=1 Tax=Scomber japonicus TaxID=13676 RepID=UPI0023058D76|nr:killer cell lectin-like receptor subfamily B member 1A [Scomber japonicus]